MDKLTAEQAAELMRRANNHTANGIRPPMAAVQAMIDMGIDPTDTLFSDDEYEPENEDAE